MGTVEQVKPWFSEKHEYYWFKTEMSLHAEDGDIIMMPHRPGRPPDVEITRGFIDENLEDTRKSEGTI